MNRDEFANGIVGGTQISQTVPLNTSPVTCCVKEGFCVQVRLGSI